VAIRAAEFGAGMRKAADFELLRPARRLNLLRHIHGCG
jgi:hypothetical protein